MAAPTMAVAPTVSIEDGNKPHTSSSKLEDHAALAALYVTKYDNAAKHGHEFLDDDHKLSSAGAAASVKYANPQDLPSFPSTGLKKSSSAAGAAASLGWANQKSIEHWKPDPSVSASTAAKMAKDYKMPPPRQPEQSANGAKAAILAHKDGAKVDVWRPQATAWGNSAASQAFKMDRAGTLSPQLGDGHTAIGRQGSLLAATGAMSGSRKRAESTPVAPKIETYPDEANALANALSAATSASKPKKRSDFSSDMGSVPYTNMSREMYTSHPPVAPEVEEQNRQDTLRASAVAMARQMYSVQQKQIDATSAAYSGAAAAHGRKPSTLTASDEVQPMRFNNLQEAAQKLAQERLAKLQDEHVKYREYRDYYGSTSQSSSRLSIRGRTRRRASSDGTLDEDKEQSNKIRAQMSIFSSNLSQIDAIKRQKDREALIAAAQRNVTKSLHGMDERVFAETGKAPPSLVSEWEVKAHTAAQAKSDTRMENYGKINIGGGKFISQSAVDLVAARNVQPVLDEINEKAEQEKVRQTELKLDQEKHQQAANEKKVREKEEKEINKKLKQQDKDEEKARKAEEKRLAKEKRKSTKSEPAGSPATVVASEPAEAETTSPLAEVEPVAESEHEHAAAPVAERHEESSTPTPIRTSMEDQASLRMRENASAANKDEVTPMSPSSPESGSKVKNWLKTKFSRRMSKGQKASVENVNKGDKAFVGGAALTGASAQNNSNPSLGAKSSSVRDVAMAGKGKEPAVEEPEERPGRSASSSVKDVAMAGKGKEPAVEEPEERLGRSASSSVKDVVVAGKGKEPAVEEPEERLGRSARRDEEVSSLSSMSEEEGESGKEEDDDFQEARDNFDDDLAPPPTIPAEKSPNTIKDSKFTEEI